MTFSGMLVVVFSVTLIVWDVIAAFGWGVRATESYWINKYLKQRPLAILGIGVLLGHWLAPMIEPKPEQQIRHVAPVESSHVKHDVK